MSAPRLDTIQITNFRSIRGTVSIPLDAPIVLLHGTNGAGKSTVMAALELVLTGRVSGISSADREHLVHHGEEEATVELVSSVGKHTIRLRDGEVIGEPVLAIDDARSSPSVAICNSGRSRVCSRSIRAMGRRSPG